MTKQTFLVADWAFARDLTRHICVVPAKMHIVEDDVDNRLILFSAD